MRLMVSGGTKAVRHWYEKRPDRIGVLCCPSAGFVRSMATAMPTAADNGCFGGLDGPKWLRMLAELVTVPELWWVTVPDVVADAGETLRRFKQWAPALKELNLPVAFVGQDGATIDSVPWSDIDGYFVGGSDDWKLSPESRALVERAKGHGLPVHMGRVNTMERFHVAAKWGCDSADGSSFSKWSDTLIPKAVRWIDMALGEPLYADK